MKKKVFLTIILTLLFVCVLSITTNAATKSVSYTISKGTSDKQLTTSSYYYSQNLQQTTASGWYSTPRMTVSNNVNMPVSSYLMNISTFTINSWSLNTTYAYLVFFDTGVNEGSFTPLVRHGLSSGDVGRTISAPSNSNMAILYVYGGTNGGSINIGFNGDDSTQSMAQCTVNCYDINDNHCETLTQMLPVGRTFYPQGILVQGYSKTMNYTAATVSSNASENVYTATGYTALQYTYTIMYKSNINGSYVSIADNYVSIPVDYKTSVTVTAPSISGYRIIGSNTKTFNIPSYNSQYTFLYEVALTSEYTINYCDTNGSALSTAYVGTADIGETLNIEPVEIVGYTPTLSGASIVIDEDSAENVYTFNYTKNSYTYNVYYKNADNVEIATSISNTALYGSIVNLTAPEIVGYAPETATYSMLIGASGNDYTFVYDIAQYPYTINFEDGNGNVLSTPVTGSADYGTTVSESAVSITGYTPNVQGCSLTIGSESNVFTFIYSPVSYTYTVNYVNSDNEILSTAYTASAYYGENVELIPREVLGYAPELSSYILTIGNENNVYTFVYSVNSYPYTVRYVDTENVELVVSTNGTANYGETVTANAVGIVGYETATETKSIVMGVENNEIVFTYTVVELPVVPPDTPDTPIDTGEFGTGENEEADLNVLQFIRLWFSKVWELLTTIEIPVLKVTAAAFLIALFLIGLVINLIGYVIGVQFGSSDMAEAVYTVKNFKQKGGNSKIGFKIDEKRKNDRF